MPFFDSIRIGASGAADTTYTVDRSLRFDPNDTYMEMTSSGGNRKTFTISLWFKLGIVQEYTGADGRTIFGAGGGGAGSSATNISLLADAYGGPRLDFLSMLGAASGSNYIRLTTNGMIRDPSAWYHVVVKVDTTQGNSPNRAKMYINGVEETAWYNYSQPDQNADTYMNAGDKHGIGANRTWSNQNTKYNYFGGYIAEFHFLDGTAYDASYFGETDSATGQWIPKEYTGGNYGTNGFYLKFADNSGTTATTLGKDSSGNSNNYTPYGFSVSAGAGNDSVEDTPTKNFATLNSLNFRGNSLSNGNLQSGTAGTAGWRHTYATFAMPSSGKWYWEVTRQGGAINSTNGICYGLADSAQVELTRDINTNSNNLYLRQSNAQYNNGTYTTPFPSTSVSDVIQFAFDADTGSMWTGLNNTWTGANPSTGSSASWTSIPSGMVPLVGSYGSNNYSTINFGQQGFTYTPPTNFKALNSENLPDSTILLPNKHFDTVLYSGNGSSQTISGLNFAPDWVWIKNRNSSSGRSHIITDTARGATQTILYPENDNESTQAQDLTAFTSDGFSVGSNERVNESSKNLVAWNWNGGDTDGKTYAVTVVSDSGNKYRFDGFGTSAVTLDLAEGGTYVFDWSDSSAQGHPIRFSTTSDGTHGGGSEYTTGVTKDDSAYKTTITVAASAPQLYYYCQNHSGMGGAVNTNSTLGSSNFDGSVQSTVKVNTTAGFSIVKFTSQSGAYTVGHGLGVAPKFLITTSRTNSTSTGRPTFTTAIDGTMDYGYINATSVFVDAVQYGIDVPSSTIFNGHNNFLGTSGTCLAYVFSEVEGYSKIGFYEGNQSSNGPFVYLGFTPAFLLIKNADNGSNRQWCIIDATRTTYNKSASAEVLFSTSTGTESVADNNFGQFSSKAAVDILSNGFKVREGETAAYTQLNRSNTHLYIAFAKSPFKNSRAR